MSTVFFDVPKGMSNEHLAYTFSAYLLGTLAFDSKTRERPLYGPYRKDPSDDNWQLDNSNDYWLHIEDGKGKLVSRYDRVDVLEAMLALFKLRFPQRAHA